MQKRDKYNKIEDFLEDSSFRRWILNQEDIHNWEDWTLESPKRAKLVEEARLFLIALGVDELEISREEIQTALAETRNKILLHEINAQKTNAFWTKGWFRAAATLLVSFSLYFFYQSHQKSNLAFNYEKLVEEDNEGLIEQTNNSSEPQVISLSDGSSVLLQPKSKLSYPKKNSGNLRKVFLSGEAFFEIKKNPSKPFLVYANEVVTKVLGTSFRVKAYENDPNVEIIVKTGKVNVSQNETISKKSIIPVDLLPNESIVFNRKKVEFEKIQTLDLKLRPVEKELEKIENLSFEFEDVPVSQIFETIEKAYSVDIEYPENTLRNCYLTSSLGDQPLTEKLKIICESLGNSTRYELNNNEIIIKSNGCN
ncbi:FecR family protein [Arcticibacterium luteifluviistationis]|uniref:Iron dicitrate transport regulator FecR n=1 Tax=Arcticibacterium luteifluviistationis TaxID=1784714 RepID=A0A2Z4GBL6_9BACT|nr:FecR family protein [Arcticibacterium luteifluviistationis]AWV98521.1 iron dicitrate transport regulator FecR [Arcticibacterium luteifluviistationis]